MCLFTIAHFAPIPSKIKRREEGWELTQDEMLDEVKKYDNQPVTEVHIVGGVLPQYDLEFYRDLFRAIRSHRPELHIKALTPVEFHYIFKKAKVSYQEGLEVLIEAGCNPSRVAEQRSLTKGSGNKLQEERSLRMGG